MPKADRERNADTQPVGTRRPGAAPWAVPLAAWLALLTLPSIAAGQGTTYVPAQDQAYDDLQLLVAEGLVRSAILGERPHSRAAFRRFLAEADERLAGHVPTPRLAEAVARLRARFGMEAPDPSGPTLSAARVDLALASSPPRAMRPGAEADLDAELNPLLQGSHDRRLVDGLTTALEAGIAVQGGRWAAMARPRVSVDVPGGGGAAGADAGATEAYARAVFGPVGVDVGRLEASWGFGAEGGGILSQNARGLDVVRFGGDRPIRLPGPFRALGMWKGSFGLAHLGRDREFPGAKAFMARVGGRPARWVEFGVNYLNIQGGDGAPEATLWDRVQDLFLVLRTERTDDDPTGLFHISDKVVGADLRVQVPDTRWALFVNFVTTDDRGFFRQPSRGYTEDALWMVGAEARGLGGEGRWDVDVAWRHAGARVHTHYQFTSGVTASRRVLGDPLGPNAAAWTGAVTWTGPGSRIRVEGSWERYSGDDFAWDVVGASSSPWYRVADNPDEVRSRLVVDYLDLTGWKGVRTSIRAGYEHVSRFGYGPGNRHNFVVQGSLRHAR